MAGRQPRTSREIVLGASTLRSLGLRVGQTVRVTIGGHPRLDRIVGQAVFPDFGQGSFTPTDLGRGAETMAAALPQAVPPGSRPGFEFLLIKFRPGAGLAAEVARFRRSAAPFCAQVQQLTCVLLTQRPNGVTDYAVIDTTPELLAGLLALLGLGVLGQLAVVSGRYQRHDFAVLKALGLLGRQVSEITTWQMTTLAGLALLIGLPLGVAAGPMELAPVRHRARHPGHGQRAGAAGAADGASRLAARERGGLVARAARRPGQPGRAAARGMKGAKAMNVLEARGICKSFGPHQVLAGVDLAVGAGEMAAVVGENGSGKSTLLRILAGDLRPDAGSVLTKGRAGYCPQATVLDDALTVDQHIRSFQAAYRIRATERAEALIARLGYAGSGTSRPAPCPGGPGRSSA